MKLLCLSDLHFEFHRDHGQSFIDSLDPDGIDALVLAGDIDVGPRIVDSLAEFCLRFKHVVYVSGNHELYGHDVREIPAWRDTARSECPNLDWLDGSVCRVGMVDFVGGTLWFPEPPPGAPTHAMNDYELIRGLVPWAYDEHRRVLASIERAMSASPPLVVVTHHLPSQRSVPPEYKNSSLNPFFVVPLDRMIAREQPTLWVHGHTHNSCDYAIGDTRIVCNPFGYARHQENPSFSDHFVVEV